MRMKRIGWKFGTCGVAALALLLAGSVAAAPPGNGDPEICDDGIDNDGDRKVDCDDRDCRDDPACTGGGGGDGGGDGIRYDYEELPSVEGGSGTISMSNDRNWVSGHAVRFHPCQTYAQGPALWERVGGGWILHELAGLPGGGKGYANGVLDGGMAVGRDQTYSADCSENVMRPVIWEPSAGTWLITELPWTGTTGGAANAAAQVDGLGVLIAGGADAMASVWYRDGVDWVEVKLGTLDDTSVAYGVGPSGAVVGSSSLADWSDPRPFVVVPEDSDADGSPDTWYRDDDGDGRNDLMHPLGSTGRALDVNVAASSCGFGVLATYWEEDGAGGWLETTLPTGRFSDGTTAEALNDADQVVGYGSRPKGRGSEQHATLWERDGAGVWSIADLNDLTELPRSTTLTTARTTNGCGDIVGSAKTRDANSQPCILTPRDSSCD